MKQSFRAKRMVKQNKRLAQASKLNLVALMDIFTHFGVLLDGESVGSDSFTK